MWERRGEDQWLVLIQKHYSVDGTVLRAVECCRSHLSTCLLHRAQTLRAKLLQSAALHTTEACACTFRRKGKERGKKRGNADSSEFDCSVHTIYERAVGRIQVSTEKERRGGGGRGTMEVRAEMEWQSSFLVFLLFSIQGREKRGGGEWNALVMVSWRP